MDVTSLAMWLHLCIRWSTPTETQATSDLCQATAQGSALMAVQNLLDGEFLQANFPATLGRSIYLPKSTDVTNLQFGLNFHFYSSLPKEAEIWGCLT